MLKQIASTPNKDGKNTNRITATVGKYLVERLQDVGIKHVFGVPGDYVLDLIDRVVESPMEFVGTCNELNAGYAADGYARLNGIGAVMVTYDVGGFSLFNAVAGACAERVPLVVISGSPHSARRRNRALMHHLATDYRLQFDIFSRITACAVHLTNAAEAPEKIDRALKLCLQQKRPVYIEIPMDIVGQQCSEPTKTSFDLDLTSDQEALREAVEEASEMLKKAKRPAILAGVEIDRFQLREPLSRLMEVCGFPLAVTIDGKTAIPEEHPQFIGIYQGGISRKEVIDVIESADCLLSLGAWFTDVGSGGFTANLDSNRIISAKEDRVRVRHHFYTEVYLRDFIESLIRSLNGKFPLLLQDELSVPKPLEKYTVRPKENITVGRLFERLDHFLSDEMVLVPDTGDALFGAAELRVNEPDSFICQAYYMSIGYALPAALGLSLARPDKRAVVIIGDGAFQMTAQELSTIIRQKVAPIVFLLNNDGYVIERLIHDGPYNEIQQWAYHRLPPVFGECHSVRAQTEDELEAALAEAEAITDRLVFVEVILDRNDCTEALGRITAIYAKMSSSSRK